MERDKSTCYGLNEWQPNPHSVRFLQSLTVLAGAAALAFVVLGSLTPFSIDVSKLQRMSWSAIGQLGWPHSDLRDVVINIGVYLPIGFTLWLLLAGQSNRLAALAMTCLTGTLMSFSLETLQQFVATRYPSWIDVLVNSAGTMTGALLAWFTVTLVVRERELSARLLMASAGNQPIEFSR